MERGRAGSGRDDEDAGEVGDGSVESGEEGTAGAGAEAAAVETDEVEEEVSGGEARFSAGDADGSSAGNRHMRSIAQRTRPIYLENSRHVKYHRKNERYTR